MINSSFIDNKNIILEDQTTFLKNTFSFIFPKYNSSCQNLLTDLTQIKVSKNG